MLKAPAKKGNFLTLGIRNFIFYGLWIAPLLFLFWWHWNFVSPAHQLLMENPWKFFFAGLLWYFLAWLSVFTVNLIWPVLLLIFFKTERIRNPKIIIQVGERFRKMEMSSPQIFTLTDTHQIWKNIVHGFFAIPSPFGALLLIGPEVSEKLDFEKFDYWICQKVIESKFYKYSRTRLLFFTVLPLSAFLGFFAGNIFFGFMQPAASAIAALMLIVTALLIFRIHKQRIIDIDFRTIRSFHLNADLYFQVLHESESPSLANRILSIEKRKQSYQKALERYSPDDSVPSVQPQLISYCFIFLFCVLSFGAGSILDKKYSQEFTLQALIQSLEKKRGHQVEIKPMDLKPAPISSTTEIKSTEPVVQKELPPELAPISKAVLSGDIRLVIRTMGMGVRLNFQDPNANGATPLLLAVKNGDLEMVYMLLTLGAKFSDTDSLGQNALFYALEAPNNRVSVLRYVLSGKVDLNQKSLSGKTVFDLAKEKNLLDAMSFLQTLETTERAPAHTGTETNP